MIRVLLVDDHTIFRSGVQRLLLDEPDICVSDQAANGIEAMALLRCHRYDLVLLDINLVGRSGLEVLAAVRSSSPGVPVLMLSMYPEDQYALLAIRSGASGYVQKDAEPAELIQAIRRTAGGGQYVSARAAPFVQGQLRGEDERLPHQRLTIREHQIMLLILRGLSPATIAEEMLISIKTVSTHRSNILNKLGVASTAELVLYAVRQAIVH